MPDATDWFTRMAEVAATDGDEWCRLSKAFDRDWKAAYMAAFVEIAMSRGWTKEDAESWEDTANDALIDGAPTHDWNPRATAEADVVECEIQAANL